MAFREVRVHEVREVLRHWLADGVGLRTIGERAGVDRKTARRYVEAAIAAGLVRECGEDQLSDELIGAVVAAVRPARANGHGAAWELLLGQETRIRDWIENEDLQLTNIHGKLTRPAGSGQRSGVRATPGGACVDLYRGLLAAHVRVAHFPADSGCGDRRL